MLDAGLVLDAAYAFGEGRFALAMHITRNKRVPLPMVLERASLLGSLGSHACTAARALSKSWNFRCSYGHESEIGK